MLENEDEPFVVKFESGCKLVFNGLNANLNDDVEDDDDDFGLFFVFCFYQTFTENGNG